MLISIKEFSISIINQFPGGLPIMFCIKLFLVCLSLSLYLLLYLKLTNKTEVESVQLGKTYIADLDKCSEDKCCLDKCRGDSCYLLYMFPGPFV